MTSFEQEYYENSAFWDPNHASDADQVRIGKVLATLPDDTESLLDVGCGDGVCCNRAATHVPSLKRVVGVDRSLEAIKHVSVEKQVGDVAALPFADQEFDAAIALEVLEHLPLPTFEAAIRELARVARRHIVVTVPYRERLRRNFARCPSCQTDFSRSLHMRSFDHGVMQRLFSVHGFHCESVAALAVPRHRGLSPMLSLARRIQGRHRAMRRALCPVCGYRDEQARGATPHASAKQSPVWKKSLKRLWPQTQAPRWFLGVYVRPAAASRSVLRHVA